MKKIISAAMLFLTVVLVRGAVFAMEPASASFPVENHGTKKITVHVSADAYEKDITVKGNGSRTLKYQFDEPGTFEYRVTCKEDSSKEYIVQFSVETDDQGQLFAVAVPRVPGKTGKPSGIVFCSPDPSEPETETEPKSESETEPEPESETELETDVPKTGDRANVPALVSVTLAAVIVGFGILRISSNKQKGKKNGDGNK